MYRARVGIDLIPNRYIHDKAVEWHRKVHKHNMELIMQRKAGTGTLDNNCPHSVNVSRGWRVNGRRKFMKEDRYKTIQRQNKVLLQRMTKVMTTGTDLFDYDEKPPPRSLNSVARKQRLMHISKRNKRLIHVLETIKPYYSVEKWEEERARQEGVLKWMAKVHYRPTRESLEAFRDRELKKLTEEMEGHGLPSADEGEGEEASQLIRPTTTTATTQEEAAPAAVTRGPSVKALKKAGSARVLKTGEEGEAAEPRRKSLTAPSTTAAAGLDGVVAPAGERQEGAVEGGEGVPRRSSVSARGEMRRGSSSSSKSGHLGRIKEAQLAAAGGAVASAADLQQVQDLFETVDRAKREGGGGASVASMSSVGTSATAAAATVGGGGGLRRTMTSTVQSGGSGESRGESSSSVVTQTRPTVVKRSNGDEPVIKVSAVFSCLPDESGLRVQVSSVEGEEMTFTTETTLPIDDARVILGLNQKKKGPLSRAELVSLVTGLVENFELVEAPGGTGGLSIVFRHRLEFSNEDQFFSMVNKNLTALQQLYLEQRQEVRRASIDFVGSAMEGAGDGAGRLAMPLVRETKTVPLLDPGYNLLSPTSGKPLAVNQVQVSFSVRDPVCGEVLITAKVLPNPATGDSLVLTLQSRVPTLALANRSAAIEYVGKVLDRLAVVRVPEQQATPGGWKLDIMTDP